MQKSTPVAAHSLVVLGAVALYAERSHARLRADPAGGILRSCLALFYRLATLLPLLAAAVVGSLCQPARGQLDLFPEAVNVFPFARVETDVLREESIAFFGYENIGATTVVGVVEGSFNWFEPTLADERVIRGQPLFFFEGTHRDVFSLKFLNQADVMRWHMLSAAEPGHSAYASVTEAGTVSSRSSTVNTDFIRAGSYDWPADAGSLPIYSPNLVVESGGTFNLQGTFQSANGDPLQSLQVGTTGVVNVLTETALLEGSVTVTIAGGEFTGNDVSVLEDSVVNLAGGTLAVDEIAVENSGKMTIADGAFVGHQAFVREGGVVNLTGGTFTLSAPGGGILGGAIGIAGDFNALGGTLDVLAAFVNPGGRFFVPSGNQQFGSGILNEGETIFTDTTVHGEVAVVASSATTIIGDVHFNDLVTGPGNFFGSGTAHFDGGYSPGDSPAAVSMEGGLALGDESTLTIELGGTETGEFDQLNIGGDATLDGNLEVALLDGFTPTAGEVFDILSIDGAQSGQFADLAEGALAAGFDEIALLLTYQAGDGNDVALVAAAWDAADFNRDAVVDGDDLAQWNSSYGQDDGADANGDGVTDGSDFLIWQQQLGSKLTATAADTAAVPEPASGGLLMWGCLAMLMRSLRD